MIWQLCSLSSYDLRNGYSTGPFLHWSRDAELEKTNREDDKKRVLINNKGETSVKNFFAVGDMAVRADEPVMLQVYTAQEYAVRAVETVEGRLRKDRRRTILEKTLSYWFWDCQVLWCCAHGCQFPVSV